jgi:hypothetical protein
MPQASQNATLRAARGAALGQPGSRPVISPVAQFDNITTRREIIQCHMDWLFVLGHWQRWLDAGGSPFHAGVTLASIYAGIKDSMNGDLGRTIRRIRQE